MKKNRLSLLLFAAILLLASCSKDKTDLPVEYKFILLDTLGNEKLEFDQGENIIFSFQVINKGSEDLFLKNFFPNDDFFRIYQNKANEGVIDYGIPYLGFTLPAGYFVNKNSIFKIDYPWNEINNKTDNTVLFGDNERPDLPVGSFITSFSQSFVFGDNIQTEEKQFEISFTIK